MRLAIQRGFLWMHKRGTCMKFIDSGAVLFA